MRRHAPIRYLAVSCFILLAAGSNLPASGQSLYAVVIDTTNVAGQSGGLAFDFIAGDANTPNNTVTMSSFATDGTLAGVGDTDSGSVTGDLPGTVSLQDAGFSEAFRGITFGTFVTFDLALTTNNAAPGVDEFSFFLTNADNTGSLVLTSDPTGSDSLFVSDIDGSSGGQQTLFAASSPNIPYTVTPLTTGVPEPDGSGLALAGLTTIGLLNRRIRKRSTISKSR